MNVEHLVGKLMEQDFINYVKSFDIFCMQETFTSTAFDFSTLFHEYKVFHAPGVKLSRHGRRCGGVALLIKKTLEQFVTSVNCKYDNILCIKLAKEMLESEKDIIFVTAYIPPYQSPYYRDKETDCGIKLLEDFLLDTYQKGEDGHLIICGDLNARIGVWDAQVDPDADDDDNFCTYPIRQSEDKTINQFGKVLMDFCTTFQCIPLNGNHSNDKTGNFTFVADQGNSVIDYFLLSPELFYSANMFFEVGSRVESKHMPIHLSFTSTENRNQSKSADYETITQLRWVSEKENEFKEAIHSEESRSTLEEATSLLDSDVELAVKKFTDLLLKAGECMKRNVKLGNTRNNTKKWFDYDCLKKKRETHKMLKQYQKTHLPEEHANYIQLRKEYKTLLLEKKKAHRILTQQTLLNHRNNTVKFWRTIKNTRTQKRIQANIDMNSWYEHFKAVLSEGKVDIENETNIEESASAENDVHVPQLDDPISEEEVRRALRNLKHGKAAGLDQVCGEFLKYAGDVVCPFLTHLFNKLYDLSIFPEEWCKSVIVPLYKKGDKSNPDNYRGISLLSTIGKLFSAILNRRMYEWAEEEEKICKEQAGFRRSYSTTDHIYTLISMAKKTVFGRRSGKMYVAFVDYKKAFDTVDREQLWQVLQKIQTSTKMIKMIKAMYLSVQSCVKWGAKFTDFFSCPLGVKQGCLFSPLIFSLLISEVANFVRLKGRHGIQLLPGLEEIFLLLFADDIVLISSTPTGLQNQLNNLNIASKKVGLSVNLDKTKVMIFRKGGHIAAREKWFLDGNELEIVNKYKYLGLTLTTMLSQNIACEEFASKAKGKIVDVMKTMWSLGSFDSTVFFRLFDSQIKPMLLYASEIWGICKVPVIESAHLFACKRLLGVPNKTPNTLVYGDSGRYPLFIESTISALRYWLKIKAMPIERFPKQALTMQENELATSGPHASNWASNIKQCLESHGFESAWTDGVTNIRAFLNSFRKSMILKFQEDWRNKLMSSERFGAYRIFKEIHKKEKLIDDITIKKFRDALIRFRFGLNELGINNRYNPLNKNCPFCPDTIEDEYHFLFVCPRYAEIRNKHLSHLKPNGLLLEECLKQVFFVNTTDNCRKTAMYIFYALKKREEDLIIFQRANCSLVQN